MKFSLVGLILAAIFLITSMLKPKKNEDGDVVIKMPLIYPVLGIVAVVGFGFALIYSAGELQENEVIWVTSMGVLFMFLGLLLILKGFVFRILIKEDGLEQISLWGKQTNMKWNEIEAIRFGKVSQNLVIKSKTGKVTAHNHLVGFQFLVDTLQEKTGITRKDMNLAEINTK